MPLNSFLRFVPVLVYGLFVLTKIIVIKEPSPMSLKEMLIDTKYVPRQFSGKWFSGNQIMRINRDLQFVLLNVDWPRSKSKLLADLDWDSTHDYYALSEDLKYALLQNGTEKELSGAFTANFTVLDLKNKKKSFTLAIDGNSRLQNVRFVGTEHAVVIVFNNDIYYKEDVSQPSTKQITYDGLPGKVYNGHERYSGDASPEGNFAIRSTKDGKKLSYLKLNVSELRNVTIPRYLSPKQIVLQYPEIMSSPYPSAAGGKTAKETLGIIDLDNISDFPLLHPPNLEDPILLEHVWANNDVLNAIWMNRLQNEMYILAYDMKEPNTYQIVFHFHESNGWIDLSQHPSPLFCQDGSMFVLILPRKQNGDDGAYKHLVLIENKPNGNVDDLTRGRFVVTEILGWKEPENLIYYAASTEDHPEERHIYSVTYPGKKITCLSCNLKSAMSKTDCLFSSAKFSTDSSHSVIECLGPGIPTVFFFKGEKQIRVWQKNKKLARTLESIRIPKNETYTFDTFDGCKAHVLLKWPSNLDTSGNVRYPMLVEAYTDLQRVTKQFDLDVNSYLAENKTIITAVIDGRNTGMESNKCLLSMYKRLGTVEIDEIVDVTRQLIEKFSYIDPNRIAIWGPRGGYAAGMVLAKDTERIFKCGISVSPVTDWRLFDAMYTEKYMGLAATNVEGYDAASLLLHAEGIKGKQYLLIHGSYPANLQYSHSALLAKILQQSDIPFNQLSYPDGDYGVAIQDYFLHQIMGSFLDKCFTLEQ